MQHIQIADQLYKKAEQRASEAGFSSVDEYIADMVSHDLSEEEASETPNLDHLFTPERLAHLDRISKAIDAGERTFSLAETEAHFEHKRKEWLDNHAS